MSEPIYNQTPEGEEPDLVKGMTNMMQGVGMANDMVVATKIYAAFKWKVKTACFTHPEIATALAEAIADCQIKVKSALVRNQVVKKFEVMKARIEEFIARPEEEQVCPKCNLALFICPCQKD